MKNTDETGTVLIPSCWTSEFDTVPQIIEPAVVYFLKVEEDGQWSLSSFTYTRADNCRGVE